MTTRQWQRSTNHSMSQKHFADRHFGCVGNHSSARIKDPQPGLAIGTDKCAHAAHGRVMKLTALHTKAPLQRCKCGEWVELRAPRGIQRSATDMPHPIKPQWIHANQCHRITANMSKQSMRTLLRTTSAQ